MNLSPIFNQVFQAGTLSFGLIAPFMGYQKHIPDDLTAIADNARLAENLGFSALWVRDVPFYDPHFGDVEQGLDPMVTLAFLSAHTQKIALGTAGLIAPLRSPIHIAKSAVSVDKLSNGQFLLGLSSGDRPVEYPAFGADILVLTGFDEGGTLPMKEVGSFNVLAEFVGKVDLPIMLAGGIADKKSVQAARALGAEGVWIGTAFIATHECRSHQKVKEWIVNSTANDLLLFRTEPYYYRSLPTELAKKCFEMSENGATRSEIAKVMNAGTGMRLGMLEGDFDNGYVSVGNGISQIDRIKTVKELIDELMG